MGVFSSLEYLTADDVEFSSVSLSYSCFLHVSSTFEIFCTISEKNLVEFWTLRFGCRSSSAEQWPIFFGYKIYPDNFNLDLKNSIDESGGCREPNERSEFTYVGCFKAMTNKTFVLATIVELLIRNLTYWLPEIWPCVSRVFFGPGFPRIGFFLKPGFLNWLIKG